MFRILLLPIYLYFVLRQSFYVAGVVIVVSGLSDYLDGVIARRYNVVSIYLQTDQAPSLSLLPDYISEQ